MGAGQVDPLNWGHGKSLAVYINAREAALLAEGLNGYFELLAGGRLPGEFAPTIDERARLYRDPERVFRVLINDVIRRDASGKRVPPYGLLRWLFRLMAWFRRTEPEVSAEAVRNVLNAFPVWLQQATIKRRTEKYRAAVQEHNETVRADLRGDRYEFTVGQEKAFFGPECQFFMRVMLPCVFIYKRWPHHLIRDIGRGSLDQQETLNGLEQLLRLDPAIQYDPVIAERLLRLLQENPPGYRALVGRVLEREFEAPDRQEIKLTIAGLLYAMFEALPKRWMKTTIPDLRSLLNVVTQARTGELGDYDKNIQDNDPAFRKGVEKRRFQWRAFISETLEKF